MDYEALFSEQLDGLREAGNYRVFHEIERKQGQFPNARRYRDSVEVGEVLGCCEMVVNNWIARYEKEGIKGLATRAGRGRPPILSQQNPLHLKKVEDEIKNHPNSVKTVVAVLEAELNLAMHPETLKRFLKKTSIGSVAPAPGSNHGRWLKTEPQKKSS